jgi:hypothetical protein
MDERRQIVKVRFELTKRLAEMAGFTGGDVEVEDGSTIDQALYTLTRKLRGTESSSLLKGGRLHPSVLVVVDGEACLPGGRDRTLAGGEMIDLFLPIAGG